MEEEQQVGGGVTLSGGELKDALMRWLAEVAPVKKRHVCVCDGAVLALGVSAGVQFTCFTGTKVQILPAEVAPVKKRHVCVCDGAMLALSAGGVPLGTQFTCFTSTKVQILAEGMCECVCVTAQC